MAGHTFDPYDPPLEHKRRTLQGRDVRSLEPSDGSDADELAIAGNETTAPRATDSDIHTDRTDEVDEADFGYGPDEAEDDRGLH
jgi:hypothetical protein